MPIQDRDYIRGTHPSNCSCAECTNKRLGKTREETHASYVFKEPRSGGTSPRTIGNRGGREQASGRRPHVPNWLKALLVIVGLCVVGLVVSTFVGSLIPLWLLFGVSVFYSVEKWASYYTWKHKTVGRTYRLILNLSVLSLLGLLIWSGVLLFSQRFMPSPLVGSLVFVFEFSVFIWLCRIVARNSWRQPSMKLTVFSAICLLLIFSFAGVQPLSTYKDSLFNSISTYFTNSDHPDTTPTSSDEISSRTGKYGDYYLGLVDTPGGYLSGNGCYDDAGDFIVLVNNENAVDPSYSQLVSFLRQDNTDQFPYIYAVSTPGVYYGSAESHVGLEQIQNIIDGTAQPGNPHVCADFAERLHNNAELAGIRCAYVNVGLAGTSGHACDAFQTTDRGLIYVDVTGWVASEPHPDRAVATVSIVVGQSYRPVSLFHEAGWQDSYVSMGTVTDFQVVWDGTWDS